MGAALLVWAVALAAPPSYELNVAADGVDRTEVLVTVTLLLPAELAALRGVTLQGVSTNLVGQLAPPSLLAPAVDPPDGLVVRELWFVVPSLAAAETLRLVLDPSAPEPNGTCFRWQADEATAPLLLFGDRPVLRYMAAPLDSTSKASREQTYKVYHHLYSPEGDRLVTKGPGGLYTHHRGIFYGFNKVTYGEGRTCDIWHCSGDAHQSHEGILEEVVGPVLGRHRVAIGWHGVGGEVFAHEERELTAVALSTGTLVEFASRLRSVGATVLLDGDPQHAGFHFRADNEVAEKTSAATWFVRPDGPGKPGETRNWPGDREHVNLPWDAMSFVLGDRRYTVLYLDRPENPKEARFSERSYGRFGSYFEYRLEPDAKLDVRYRLWLQEGELTVEDGWARSRDYVSPPTVTVTPRDQ